MKNIRRLAERLLLLAPGKEWSFSGEDYDTLDWQDKITPKPTVAELEAVSDNILNTEKANSEANETFQSREMQALIAAIADRLNITSTVFDREVKNIYKLL